MNTLITLAVIVLILVAIFWVLTKIPMEPPVRTIVMSVVGIIALLILLALLFGMLPFPRLKVYGSIEVPTPEVTCTTFNPPVMMTAL